MAFYGNSIAPFPPSPLLFPPIRPVDSVGSYRVSLRNLSHNVDMIRDAARIVRAGNPIDRSIDRSVVVIAPDRLILYHVDRIVLL